MRLRTSVARKRSGKHSLASNGISTSGPIRAMRKAKTSLDVVLKAAELAAHKHREQRRKDSSKSPYINHPLALARILVEEGGVNDSVVIAAALLHDTIEDTATAHQELRGQFGQAVADVVAEVTDTKWLKK